eukprot:3291615-Prymnesium_polylepis.1
MASEALEAGGTDRARHAGDGATEPTRGRVGAQRALSESILRVDDCSAAVASRCAVSSEMSRLPRTSRLWSD